MTSKSRDRWLGRLTSVLCMMVLAAAGPTAEAGAINAKGIENAALADLGDHGPNAARVKVQILLDRQRFSPGVIDGLKGENTRLAIKAFQEARGLDPTGELNRATWEALNNSSTGPILRDYRTTNDDVSGPFVQIPKQMEAQAKLDRLAYTSSHELLAEKFHMDEELLLTLNPGKNFDEPGTSITVARVRSDGLGNVARVEVDKDSSAVRAYGEEGGLLAHFPATVGSKARPAPTGTFKITRIVKDPPYTYRPELDFEGVEADKPFDIAPGPNNPVGIVWIEIDKDGYGLHGTPDPARIGKTSSHGCVRLTNWDAEDLASGVKTGAAVEFR